MNTSSKSINSVPDARLALQQIQTLLEEILTWRELQAKTRESLTKACNHVDLARYDLNQVWKGMYHLDAVNEK